MQHLHTQTGIQTQILMKNIAPESQKIYMRWKHQHFYTKKLRYFILNSLQWLKWCKLISGQF